MAGTFSALTKPASLVDRRKPSVILGRLHHAQDVGANRGVASSVRSGHGPGRAGLVECCAAYTSDRGANACL